MQFFSPQLLTPSRPLKKTFKKKYKPLVIVGGCVAQAESNEMLKREPYIDMVIGPQSYHNIPDLVLKFFRKQQKFDLTEFDVIRKFVPPGAIDHEICLVSNRCNK